MKFNKILLLQQNMLGDVIVSTGLVRAIREEFPQSKIAFLVSPATANLMRLPFVDELIAYEKGMPMLPVIKKIWRYDVALCLDFKYRSAVLPFLARIPVRAGLAHKRKIFLTHSVPRPEILDGEYFTEFIARILEMCIGLKLHHDMTRLSVAAATAADISAVDKILPPSEKVTVAIAPFSSTPMKDWLPDRYKLFMENFSGCRFVLIGGKKDRAQDFYIPEGTVDLRGRLSMTESAEALRRADYFIGGCSAPLHLASAVGTPTLALYGSTRPEMWAPRHKSIYIFHKLSCWPCNVDGYGKTCGGAKPCMNAISVDEVSAAFEKLRHQFPARKV